jgi:two-component system response regulator HydG
MSPKGPEGSLARILCVDDDPIAVALKQAILEKAGHKVVACVSAEEAVRALEQQTFDAVVTDWRLGDGLGRAVVQSAKAHASLPVIVVSGYVCEAFQAAEPLADLYLEKPVNPEELVKVMDTLLRGRPRTQAVLPR